MRQRNAMKPLALTLLLSFLLSPLCEAATQEKVLRRSLQSSPETLDPHTSIGIHPLMVIRDLFEGLTNASPDNGVLPGVAEKWEISEDGKHYKFYLRKNAKWSDGTSVLAKHFVRGMRRAITPKTAAPKASLMYIIENAEAILKGKIKNVKKLGVRYEGDHILHIQLAYPNPYFLNMLTHSVFFPMRGSFMAKYAKRFPKDKKFITNGAYSLSDWQPQGSITLKKNPHYWDSEKVAIDKVIHIPVEDQNVLFKMYRAGEVDFAYVIPDSQYKYIKQNFAAEFKGGPYLSTAGLGCNLLRAPFKDKPKLRKALSMAINREFIVDKVTGTGETPAYSWMDPSMKDAAIPFVDYKELPFAQQFELAQKLYQEAGYSKDNPLEVELRYDTNENHKRLVIAVASMWKKLGVRVKLINEELKVFLTNRRMRQVTEAFRNFYQMDFYDPYSFTQLFLDGSGMNMTGYSSPEYETAYKNAVQVADPQERMTAFKNVAAMAQDSHALIPLYHSVIKRLVKPYVKGYEHNSLDIIYSKNLDIVRQ